MDPVWLNIFSVLIVFALAIVSPGPNFIMVVNTALSDSRRSGIFTSLGVATGSGLFALSGMLGLILVVNSLPNFAIIARIVGGAYLLWLGYNLLRSSRNMSVAPTQQSTETSTMSRSTAYRTGLLTNLTNPKAWAFYFSLFTLVMTPDTPFWAKAALNLSMLVISFAWYAFVAILITDRRVQPKFIRVQSVLQSCLGFVLIWLGGRLLIASR